MTKGKRPSQRGKKTGRVNPPSHSQFRPGRSGNPNGRPPGSKNLSTLLMQAAQEPVVATIRGKPRKISAIHATTMQLATKAASGNPAAMSKFLDWFDEIETRAAANRPRQFQLDVPDVEVLRATYARLIACNSGVPEE